MQFNKYFSKEDLSNIYTTNMEYTHSYHLTVTFNYRTNIDRYIDKLSRYMHSNTFYGWKCYTSRNKKTNNPHPRKKHIHVVIFSNMQLDLNKFPDNIKCYDSKLVDVKTVHTLDDGLERVLKYIHDGHHLINDNYYVDNISPSTVRERISSLRISSR